MTTQQWSVQPDVQQLLNRLIDRIEDAELRGSSGVRPLKLDERSFPALYLAELESAREAAWENVTRLEREGWIQVKLDRPTLGTAPYERNPRIAVANEAAIRVATGRPVRIRSALELWQAAVDVGLNAPHGIKQIVRRSPLAVPGREPAEVMARLNLLFAMADAPLLLREVSAQLFWNQSKILDGRQTLVAAILGVEACPFPEMPIHLQVALPLTSIRGVLFIENLTTFERATREPGPRFDGLILVFSSGYKASAKRLRLPSGVSIYLASHGNRDPQVEQVFTHWLFNHGSLPCWFWGDLDHAGMGILAALRASFPAMGAWPQGYAPMLALLEDGHGHPPEQAGKQYQLPVERTGCDYADRWLIPALAIHQKFVDQEAV